MRKFSPTIFDEIARELAFIWTAHRIHKLQGKMRLFTPKSTNDWENKDVGIEIWFGPSEIGDVIPKLQLFYNEGRLEKSAYLLDPVVYEITDSAPPKPIGSGIVWATARCDEGQQISDETLNRLHDLNIFTSLLHHKNNKRAGLKMIGYLKKTALPLQDHIIENGNSIDGVTGLAELVDVSADKEFSKHYMLSGLEYMTKEGCYQSVSYQDMHENIAFSSAEHIESHSLHQQHLLDAVTCWNAYGRNAHIYSLYGTVVANIKSNLAEKSKVDDMVNQICNELNVIWDSNLRCKLTGKMRLYSADHQDAWRCKEPGLEFYFDETQTNEAAEFIGLKYNEGRLPNTPLLLDPVVYEADEDGNYTPKGCSVVWVGGINVGLETFNKDAWQRIQNLGLLAGKIQRAGQEDSGIKAFGFLDKPYLFNEQEIAQYTSKNSDNPPKTIDNIPISGCEELFNIIACNGQELWHTYLLTGMEYLSTNGSFSNLEMEEVFVEDTETRRTLLEKYTISHQRILDAAHCWKNYDGLHPLWQRFGIDVSTLEENLKYYNMVGRDFTLLNMTGDAREDAEDDFEFFVKGWIPKAAVTVLVATGGTGKSSLAHRLAILASTDWRDDEPNPKFLGSEIDKNDCRGLVVYFSGEDSPAIVNARAEMIDPEGRSKRLLLKCGNEFDQNADGSEGTIGDFLDYLDKLPDVAMCVIDPARKYLIGDEENGETVSDFFEAIENFAIKKNCAMIVVHHMVKGAHPNDSRDMLDMLRGSQVFIDRPRVVIGLYRDDAHTVAGLSKNNIPPGLGMVEGERIFVRDPKHLDLFWVPGPEGIRTFTVSEAELLAMREEAEKAEKIEKAK